MEIARKKKERFSRLYDQLLPLLKKSPSAEAQMLTINAVLYHKVPYIFWVGFYHINDKSLIVGPYQGPLACQILVYPHGVCWSSIIRKEPLIIGDVSQFPDHISCDSRSKSEIAIPLFDKMTGEAYGVFDVDSNQAHAFDETDLQGFSDILSLLKY